LRRPAGWVCSPALAPLVACEFSLAADTFDAAADLFVAAGAQCDAEECRELSDANAIQAMDRILRIAAETAPAPASGEVVLEVLDGR
jgi:hypothetical protein